MSRTSATEKRTATGEWIAPVSEDEDRASYFAAMLDPDSPPSPQDILDALAAGWRMEDDPKGMSAASLYVDSEVLRAFVAKHGYNWQRAMREALRHAEPGDRSA
ncbi:MAG TPA: hypothetical protein PKE65_01185 [Rhizobiaceae bacterium]|nr:hypothetical protein [Rhizobiaceae bacterium]